MSPDIRAPLVLFYHNALKSLVFGLAELCFGLAMQYLFACVASGCNLFTPFMMFAEGIRQRLLFVWDRGFRSGPGGLVLAFSITLLAAKFYGTMLWSLDSPGYLLVGTNKTITAFQNPVVASADSVIHLSVSPDDLWSVERDLPRRMTINLFAVENLTLTEKVSQGQPEVVDATRSGLGARIWLDDKGFSVSPDDSVMEVREKDASGRTVSAICLVDLLPRTDGLIWNCAFNNSAAQELVPRSTTRPMLHWDDETDQAFDTRYILPNRLDNIWATLGMGVGTGLMKQVFTVTKGNRRHVFLHTAYRYAMVTPPISRFDRSQIDDFLLRSWSTNESVQEMYMERLALVSRSVRLAQAQGKSFIHGFNFPINNTSTFQARWEYLTYESDGPVYSTLRFSTSEITLLRSETLPAHRVPTPFNNQTCQGSFMNLAYGGRVVGTDCLLSETDVEWSAAHNLSTTARFFGQVDTSAVLVITGLGDSRANESAVAVDDAVARWLDTRYPRLDALLIARGYAVGVDPALVTVTQTSVVPAVSLLQLVLAAVPVILFVVTWIAISFLPEQWSHTPLWNLVVSTAGGEAPLRSEGFWGRVWAWLWGKMIGGDLVHFHEVALKDTGEKQVMTIAGGEVMWASPADTADTPAPLKFMV